MLSIETSLQFVPLCDNTLLPSTSPTTSCATNQSAGSPRDWNDATIPEGFSRWTAVVYLIRMKVTVTACYNKPYYCFRRKINTNMYWRSLYCLHWKVTIILVRCVNQLLSTAGGFFPQFNRCMMTGSLGGMFRGFQLLRPLSTITMQLSRPSTSGFSFVRTMVVGKIKCRNVPHQSIGMLMNDISFMRPLLPSSWFSVQWWVWLPSVKLSV